MNTANRKLLLVATALTVVLAGCSSAEKNVAPAPVPAPVAAPAPPPPPPPPMVKAPAPTYVIEDVNFEFDNSNLKPLAIETLDEVANELREQPDVHYQVAGFTDSVGSAAYNQGLSERRAESVRAYLVGRGVDGGQLSVRGHGEANPVADNGSKEGRAKNRRVEIQPAK